MSALDSFNRLYDGLNLAQLSQAKGQKRAEQSSLPKVQNIIHSQGEKLEDLEIKAAHLLDYSKSLRSEKSNAQKREVVSQDRTPQDDSNSWKNTVANWVWGGVEKIVEKKVENTVNAKLTPLTGLEYNDLKNLDGENIEDVAHKASSHIANRGLKPLLGIELADLENLNKDNYQDVASKVGSHLSQKITGLNPTEMDNIEKAIDIALERLFAEEEKKSFSVNSAKQFINDVMTLYRAKKAINKSVEHLSGLSTGDWKNLKTGAKTFASQLINEETPSLLQNVRDHLIFNQSRDSLSKFKLIELLNTIKEHGPESLESFKSGIDHFFMNLS